MKKIMFNDRYGLTEAVLSGRKTQTRRIVTTNVLCACDLTDSPPMVTDSNGDWHDLIKTSRYKVGEVVAVAQNYEDAGVDFIPEEDEEFGCYNFLAEQTHGWTNKLYVRSGLMPHRIRITNVRVERLLDISDENCEKEGVYEFSEDPMNPQAVCWTFPNSPVAYYSPREAYAALIDRIAGKGTWQSNPYVFVYDFELVK